MDDAEKSGVMDFELLRAATGDAVAARLGRLAVSGRRIVETPNFLGTTSRGVIPHITPDNLTRHTQILGAYYALEDFVERRQYSPPKGPPIFATPPSPQNRSLHAFTATPSPMITVLGARRLKRVAAGGNTKQAVSIFTSTGSQQLTTDEYEQAVLTLRPDIAVPLADLTAASDTPKAKRALRMAERTDEWIIRWLDALAVNQGLASSGISTFAPVLPIPYSMQWEYLERLSEDKSQSIKGLAIYDVDVLPDLQELQTLIPLPRLSLDAPATPHHILRQVSLGVDVFLPAFLNSISDAGIALSFTFPPPEPTLGSSRVLPLGIDLSFTEHRSSLAPLQEGCLCYACTHHHRAYVNHLLLVREMLGWTLLQVHNYAVADAFFAGIRTTLADGNAAFEAARDRFTAVYEPELPEGTGERPRARGYHFKSEGGDEKINKVTFRALKMGDKPSKDPEDVDMAETPLVPDESSRELDQKGFAEAHRKEA